MFEEVGFLGDRTYYTKMGDVYYRVSIDQALFAICGGQPYEDEINIYVEIDGNVTGDEDGGLNKTVEFEEFADSDFDMNIDDDQPEITREGSDDVSLGRKHRQISGGDSVNMHFSGEGWHEVCHTVQVE
ncbi:hypothetical protein Salat_2613800 [Sesamum alatum]|uniref:Uncharacterized protein n=1 Tax=Sesamum alatum TaxID=300844 RepID=A0AAE2CAJ4_9LAMI|nr:hypothetical protein Salat_2613800 [Sesamum alatum]